MFSTCYSCILDRAKFEADLVFQKDEDKKEVMEELIDFMACHKGGVPALVATQRESIIKRRSGNLDPYRALKAESNQVAFDLLPVARKFFDCSKNKLEALIRIAAAANSMEFGVKGYDYDNTTFYRVFEETLEETLNGEVVEAENLLRRYENILYLTDNAGEIVFDLFVIDELKKMGKKVVIAPKTEPVLNDVTAEELREMTSYEVIPTGPIVGTSLDQINPDARNLLLNERWLVISKGMGNFETISEFQEKLQGRLIYILRAKCEPVATNLGVSRGTLVAKEAR
jgi:damage-control phosphatase, subfamily I